LALYYTIQFADSFVLRHLDPSNFGVGRLDGSKSYSNSAGKVTSHFFGQSSFAKHAVVGASCCVEVGQSFDLAKVAALGCGIMTGSGTMLNVIQPSSDDTVSVVGCGAVGLVAIMAASISIPSHHPRLSSLSISSIRAYIWPRNMAQPILSTPRK